MKKFTHFILAGLFTLFLTDSFGQNQGPAFRSTTKPARGSQASRISPENRCGTMEALENYFRANPEARAQAERNKNTFAPETSSQNQRVQAVVNIPVVFHIVGSAARQAAVTDADILWQLNKLNEDYGGSNADSTNGTGFYPVRAYNGYNQIRYCMAQRNALDLPSNGIERVVSTLTGAQNCGNNNLIKHTSSGGADAWDPSRFLNIWVGEFGPCLLGVATFPGTGAANEQGLIVSYEGFSNNLAYADPSFALGRTAAHELGHYWGLYHIWGDDGSACTGSDFRQLPGTCLLPASLAGTANDQSVGDTPNMAGATTNCPTGVVTDACSAVAPGRQYQNYMDYTEDACYSMFTMKQADRMHWVLDNCRASLKTSNGCTPPPAAAGNDARISVIISPAAGANIGCTTVTPVVTIQNMGSNTLTSATINVRLNGGAPVTTAWTGSLTIGQSANVTLPAVNVVPAGSHTLQIHTTLPNGLTDANPSNDTATVTFTRIAAASLPVSNGFETTFLPPGWANNNPNGDALTWFRFNPAGGSAGGSVWAAVMDNYSFDLPGTVDDIVTPVINTSTVPATDSIQISWDLAHKNYPDPGFEDSLKILVSSNCGATWTTVWQRGDPQLATAGSTTGLYNPPAQADWRNHKVSIGPSLFGAGQIQVAIRNVNGFGNTMFIDNINIDIKPKKDLSTSAVLRPNATECAPPFTPSITVRNTGGEAVTGFKTGYILNNGTPVIQAHNIQLAVGESTTVTFPSINPPAGNNTIKLFVTDPLSQTPGPDVVPINDTLVRTFSVPVTVANVVEGFEGATFVPSNWALFNSNNNVTWIRKTPGKSSNFSAFIDNYNNNTVGQLDIIQAPPIRTTGADSVIITFDVAHKDYPGALDRLRVLASTNCSVSFTSVFSKAGSTLATAGDSDADYTTPAESEWRRETIRLGGTFTASGNLIIQFENRNDWGNNIFIDNINIIPKFKRDIEVLSASPDVVCAAAYTPVATIRNRGTETITGYKIAYRVGTGAPDTTIVTGVSIAPDATATVTLRTGTLAQGANSIRIYTFDPVTASGTGDQYLVNDSILKVSYATIAQATAPLVETFESSTFAPAGWAISNADNSITWQRSTSGRNSGGAAYMRNFTYLNANGSRDLLYSPVVNFSGADSVTLTFDLSAATKASPGAAVPMDTLEVLVTRDCGNTFTSVYKKWGTALQTLYDPVTPTPFEYTPFATYMWRTEMIDLSSFRPDGPLQVVFKSSSNGGNNVFIDNVNFRTRTLPSRLRADGVIIAPSPFANQFNIWYVQAPTDLRYVSIFNSAGQLMWRQVFPSGSTANVIPVDLTNKAAGVYIVHLGYSDQSKDKQIRIIKANE